MAKLTIPAPEESRNYNDANLRIAEEIIDKLFKAKLRDEDFDEKLTVYDIEHDIYDFNETRRIFRRFYLDKVPALSVGEEEIPVSLSALGIHINSPFEYLGSIRNIIKRAIRGEGHVRMITSKNAEKTFRRLASQFLAMRLAALSKDNQFDENSTLNLFRRWSWKEGEGTRRSGASSRRGPGGGGSGGGGGGNGGGSSRIAVHGCPIKVTTNTRGLRVLWSGAYYIVNNFFGSPSTPVSGSLSSGHYVFGVDGGAYGNSPQWDHTTVSLPGPTTSIHLNF